jgi:hypothetical protein
MKEDLTRPGTMPQAPNGRTGTAWARPAAASPIQGLQWLRQRVLERLDALEALARRLEAPPDAAEVADLEQTLRQRLAEVEEARRRVHAEAERREREWNESLAQLEADRRLLAEAWERIERQRIERPGASDGHLRPHALVQGPPKGGPAVPPHTAAPAPARSAVIDQDPSNPVARAILREFQALTRDVRSNAARHDPS